MPKEEELKICLFFLFSCYSSLREHLAYKASSLTLVMCPMNPTSGPLHVNVVGPTYIFIFSILPCTIIL